MPSKTRLSFEKRREETFDESEQRRSVCFWVSRKRSGGVFNQAFVALFDGWIRNESPYFASKEKEELFTDDNFADDPVLETGLQTSVVSVERRIRSQSDCFSTRLLHCEPRFFRTSTHKSLFSPSFPVFGFGVFCAKGNSKRPGDCDTKFIPEVTCFQRLHQKKHKWRETVLPPIKSTWNHSWYLVPDFHHSMLRECKHILIIKR